MRRTLCLASLATTLVLPIASAHAQQNIGFEGLGFGVIPPDYAGLTWSVNGGWNNWYVAVAGGPFSRPSSGSNNAFSDAGSAIWFMMPGGTFDLNSMFLSEMLSGPPDRTDVDVTIMGLLNGIVVHSTSFALDHTTMQDYSFNWSNIDQVIINPIKGRLVVDDISITATPEPGTLVLMATGLIGLVWLRRRNTRRART